MTKGISLWDIFLFYEYNIPMFNKEFISNLKQEKEFQILIQKIKKEYESKTIYPKKEDIFRFLKFYDISKTRVVIFGQDPYYQKDVADGLAFSTRNSKTPASLKNIFLELRNQYNDIKIYSNDLSSWAKQGVLLLNTSLTVEENKPNSHKNIGWNYVIEYIIRYINNNLTNVVFVLWGNNAKSLSSLIDLDNHYILKSSHPSPLSAHQGFFGNNHFIKINDILRKCNKEEIDWNVW